MMKFVNVSLQDIFNMMVYSLFLIYHQIFNNIGEYDTLISRSSINDKNNFGNSYRQIIDLDDLNNDSLFISSLGSSENILSDFYENLNQILIDGDFIQMKNFNFVIFKKLILFPK
jgi:hypothetical protein